MDIREPILAGSWYPGKRKELSDMVEGFLDSAKKMGLGRVRALIAPHAGYIYSGQVAGYSYKQVQGEKYGKVIVMAPSHHVGFVGASIIDASNYRTPLGDIKVSDEVSALRKESKQIVNVPEADVEEHSLEIQLPFLQKALGEFELIPMILGELSPAGIEQLADTLIKHIDEDTLVVVSTDLSHFHPYDTAVSMDNVCINSITGRDYQRARACEMCGRFPVLVLMTIAKKLGWESKLLKYKNSCDVTGDYSGVVGYAAIAFHSKETGSVGPEPVKEIGQLNKEEGHQLLKIARETMERYLKDGEVYEPEIADAVLKEPRGIFVTLEKRGQLRGCIGCIDAREPLYLGVRDNAINAAVNDPRFQHLVEEELEHIEIEISVLTKPEGLKAKTAEERLDEIRPGIDGLILEYKGRGATYLPQVWEQITDKKEFLESLCMKAGIPADSWKKKEAKLSKYQVQAFKEKDYE